MKMSKILCERFVQMTLPRSVKEMSKLDFLPRHCNSENFRGFSFIGEDFPLPERSVRYYIFIAWVEMSFQLKYVHSIARAHN